MKTARLFAAILVATVALVATATLPAIAQCVPDVPIGPAPASVTSASQSIVTGSAGTSVTFLVAPALGPFVPALPVWLPLMQRSAPGAAAAARELHARPRAEARQRIARIGTR